MFSTGLNANTDANCGESYDDGANVERTIVILVCGRCESENLRFYGYYENDDFTIFYITRIECKDCGKVTKLPEYIFE